jgi:hypothetical protein
MKRTTLHWERASFIPDFGCADGVPCVTILLPRGVDLTRAANQSPAHINLPLFPPHNAHIWKARVRLQFLPNLFPLPISPPSPFQSSYALTSMASRGKNSDAKVQFYAKSSTPGGQLGFPITTASCCATTSFTTSWWALSLATQRCWDPSLASSRRWVPNGHGSRAVRAVEVTDTWPPHPHKPTCSDSTRRCGTAPNLLSVPNMVRLWCGWDSWKSIYFCKCCKFMVIFFFYGLASRVQFLFWQGTYRVWTEWLSWLLDVVESVVKSQVK